VFLIKTEGDVTSISFTYSNEENLSGYAILYLNGSVVATEALQNNEETSIDISEFLNETDYYTFKLVAIDENKSIDSLEFKVLYNYENLDDFSFVHESSSQSYIVSEYTGSSSSIMIPPVFEGSQGILPVLKIANGIFFDNDVLLSVEIPSTITNIGSAAFFSCSNLTTVTLLSTTPPVLGGDNVFDPYSELSVLKIYVPAESVQAYKTAQYWTEYANSIYAIPE
jgi:hypothetical protein